MKMETLSRRLFLGRHGARASGKPASSENPPALGLEGRKVGGPLRLERVHREGAATCWKPQHPPSAAPAGGGVHSPSWHKYSH